MPELGWLWDFRILEREWSVRIVSLFGLTMLRGSYGLLSTGFMRSAGFFLEFQKKSKKPFKSLLNPPILLVSEARVLWWVLRTDDNLTEDRYFLPKSSEEAILGYSNRR